MHRGSWLSEIDDTSKRHDSERLLALITLPSFTLDLLSWEVFNIISCRSDTEIYEVPYISLFVIVPQNILVHEVDEIFLYSFC